MIEIKLKPIKGTEIIIIYNTDFRPVPRMTVRTAFMNRII